MVSAKQCASATSTLKSSCPVPHLSHIEHVRQFHGALLHLNREPSLLLAA